MSLKKIKKTYRRDTIRLRSWDYSWSAMYFVTICTKDKKHYFGRIENDVMQLSKIGEIVEIEWQKTAYLRPDMNIILGEFIIMPNHFHAIIGIGDNKFNSYTDKTDESLAVDANCQDKIAAENRFAPQSKNLAAIIRGFKGSVTRQARLINPRFGWQNRYHDHIIRNGKSFDMIASYIANNPLTWNKDCYR